MKLDLQFFIFESNSKSRFFQGKMLENRPILVITFTTHEIEYVLNKHTNQIVEGDKVMKWSSGSGGWLSRRRVWVQVAGLSELFPQKCIL